MAALIVAVLAEWSALAVLTLTFAATIAGTPCYPAVAALVPRTVPTADLAAANALFTTVESTAFVVGPAIGGALLALGPPSVTFAANGVLFGLALVLLRPLAPTSASTMTHDVVGTSFVHQFIDGVRAVIGSAEVAIPLSFMAVMNFVYGMSLVALLLIATDLMDVGAEGFGFLNAALGAGASGVMLVSNRFVASGSPLRVLTCAVLASSVPFAVLAVVTSLPVALGLTFVAGAGGLLTEVVGVMILQRVLDERILARVFGILDTTVVGAILAGSAVVPPLVRLVGLRWTLVIGGALVPVLSLVAVPRLRQLLRSARARRREFAAPVHLLAHLPVFRHAPRPRDRTHRSGHGRRGLQHRRDDHHTGRRPGRLLRDRLGPGRSTASMRRAPTWSTSWAPATGSVRSACSRACRVPRPSGRSSRWCSVGSPGTSSSLRSTARRPPPQHREAG